MNTQHAHTLLHRQSLSLAVLVALVLFGLSSVGAAQESVLIDGTSIYSIPQEERATLAALEDESRWVTALYVGGAIGIPVGLLTLAASPFVGGFFALGGSSGVFLGIAATGASIAGLGLIAIGVGIGLDIDVGSKRGAFQQRIRARFSGTRLVLEGSFG